MDSQSAHRGAGPGAHEGPTQSRALAEAEDGEWVQAQRAHVLSQAFVPDKTCERYLLEDCATTLPSCAAWLPMLVMESRKLAHAIMKRGMTQGLSRELTLALVVYTADMRHFGASDEHNLYHGINIALLNAQDTAARVQIHEMTRGYLHFFSRALALLPGHTLLIAGEGEERTALQRLAGEVGVTSRVRLLGRRLPAELPALYSAADALVLAAGSAIARSTGMTLPTTSP